MPAKPKNPVLDGVPVRALQEQPKKAIDTGTRRKNFGVLLPVCCKQAVASGVHSAPPSSGRVSSDNYRWTVRLKEKKGAKPKAVPSDPADSIPDLEDVLITITDFPEDVSSVAEGVSFEEITAQQQQQQQQPSWSEAHWEQLTAIPGVLVDPSEEPVLRPPPAIVAKSSTKPKTPKAGLNAPCDDAKKQQVTREAVSLVSVKKAEKKLRQKERRMAERARKEKAARAREAKKQEKEARKQKKLQKKAERANAKAKAKEMRKKKAKRNAVVPIAHPIAPGEKPVAPAPSADWAVSKKPAVMEDASTSSPVPPAEDRSTELIAAKESEVAITENKEADKYWETNTVRVTICPKPIVFSNKQTTAALASPKEGPKPRRVFTRPKGAHHNSIRSVTRDMSYYNHLRKQLAQDASLPIDVDNMRVCKKGGNCQSADESDEDSGSEFDFEFPATEEKPQAAKQSCTSPAEKNGKPEGGLKNSSSSSSSECAESPSSGVVEELPRPPETVAELGHTQSEHCYSSALHQRASRGEEKDSQIYGLHESFEGIIIQH